MTTLVARRAFRNLPSCKQSLFANAFKSCLTESTVVTLRSRLIKLVATYIVALMGQSLALAQVSPHPFMTPRAVATLHALQSPNAPDFENGSFEWLLERSAQENEVSIWCDRRIARDTILSLKKADQGQAFETIEQLLSTACDQVDAALLPMDGVVAVVPKANRDLLAAAYWNLLTSKNSSWTANSIAMPLSWTKGTSALDILDQFRRLHLPTISTSPKVEYDLWPAFQFQKVSVAAVSICLLGSFDLCLTEGDQGLEIKSLTDFESSMERGVLVDWLYEQKQVDRTNQDSRKAWKQRWPDSVGTRSIKPPGSQISARAMAHYDFAKLLNPPRPKQAPNSTQVFSGEVRADLPRLLSWISNRYQLEFFPLPLPPDYAAKEIKLNVQKVTMDELLDLVAKEAAIEFKKFGKRVEIVIPSRERND